MPIEYRMDSQLFHAPGVLKESAELSVFAPGMKAYRVEKRISELTQF